VRPDGHQARSSITPLPRCHLKHEIRCQIRAGRYICRPVVRLHQGLGCCSECLCPRCASLTSQRLDDAKSKQHRVVFAVQLSLLSICTLALGGGTNFEACLSNVINSGSLEGTVDINGAPTTNISLITGLTYDRCVSACGRGAVAFDWQTFSQQFTSWLLPWLALISQLPYGSGDALSNCLVVFLTVGSPTLAAYSLSLAIISNRWMVKRFERTTYTNSRLAAQSLSSLQQVSLDVPKEEHVLPSLIVLPANRKWWKTLARELDYPVPKWTLASTMSVIYLALADIFAWVSNLANPLSNGQVYATGQGISSLWLCFLPIVIGNLLLSPKSDWDRIRQAFKLANSSFRAARGDSSLKRCLPKRGLPRRDLSRPDLPKRCNESQFIKVRTAPRDAIEEDEICSASVFFYARAFTWLRLVEKVADSFDAASQRASIRSANEILPRTRLQVIAYCKSEDQSITGHTTYETYSIFARSAFLAVFLQWGTTGAAIMAQYFTPTKGRLIDANSIFTDFMISVQVLDVDQELICSMAASPP
jgi:hypothetical protein